MVVKTIIIQDGCKNNYHTGLALRCEQLILRVVVRTLICYQDQKI